MLYFILFELMLNFTHICAVFNYNKVLNKYWMYTSRWLQSFSSWICGRYPRNWMNSMLVVLTFHWAGGNKHTPLESKRKSLHVMLKLTFFGTTHKHSSDWVCTYLKRLKSGERNTIFWTTVWWPFFWLHLLPPLPLTFVLQFHCSLLVFGICDSARAWLRPNFKTVWNL